jgi:hypothetical protein
VCGCFERGRIVDAVGMQIQRLGVNSFVQTIRGSFVQQIEPAKDAMRMEEVDKLFSMAFEQTCALKVIDGFAVNCLPPELRAAEVTAVLEEQARLSKAALSDHGYQFKEQCEEWRRECRVEVYFARSSYPQDKG